jgi:hypothetical protein
MRLGTKRTKSHPTGVKNDALCGNENRLRWPPVAVIEPRSLASKSSFAILRPRGNLARSRRDLAQRVGPGAVNGLVMSLPVRRARSIHL